MKNIISHRLYILTMVVSMLITAETAAGQTGYGISWYLLRDDNMFKSRTQYSELINTASMYLTRTFTINSARLQAYAGTDLAYFDEFTEQRNNTYKFSLFGRIPGKKVNFDLGISGRIRRNDAQYIYFNTDSYDFFVQMNYAPAFAADYSMGFTYSKSNFSEFEELNNVEYSFFGKFRKSFQSRLSAYGTISIGVKDYVNQSIITYTGASGMMAGRSRYNEEPVNVVQLYASGNIGKSVTNKTGINSSFGGSWFLGGAIEAYSDGIYYFTENDLYDDPYSYEDLFVTLNLTRQFLVGFQSRIGTEYHAKNYKGTPALTAEGDITESYREDTRNEYYFQVSKRFETKWKAVNRVELFFRFLMRQNNSNDPYYDYTDHLGIAGLKISR